MKTFKIIDEKVLNNIVQGINAAVILHNRQLKVIFINDPFEEIFEIKKENALGKTPLEFLPDFDQRHKDAIVNRLKSTLQTGVKSQTHEFTYYSPNGNLHYLSASSIPIFDHSNHITYIMSIVNDLTNQKKLEKEVVESAKLSSIADVSYTLAHEINNPLTGIKLGLSTLYGSLEKKENIQILDSVMKDLNRIQKTVSSFLRAKKTEYRIRKRNQRIIGEIVEEVLFHLRSQLESKNITVKKKLCTQDLDIFIDRDRIYQLLLNLFLNASQAIPDKGKITISTRINSPEETLSSEISFLCISLADTGIGINHKHLPEIFKPFYSLKPGGTGLGLSICKEIVSAHKGIINVESQRGAGTIFTIYLPIIDQEGSGPWK
jgi:two-component system, sporulation sensor kinase C